jgi:hypothetical protein
MTYSNATEARRDLINFGARPLLHAISERLSMDDVLPRGRHVEFDTETYIGDAGTHLMPDGTTMVNETVSESVDL